MGQAEFVKTLPEVTDCAYCHRLITGLDWGVGPYKSQGFMGICIVKCAHCKWVKIAAAGSTLEAHQEAQRMRQKLIGITGM